MKIFRVGSLILPASFIKRWHFRMSFAISSLKLPDIYYEEQQTDSELEPKASSYPKK
jgi:hypothetical protein